jgi:transposase
MRAEDMKTANMSKFLKKVSRKHSGKFVVMVLDGASTHKSKDLIIPSNVSLIILPPYSPELNPTERLWNVLRRDYFANRYFDSLEAAMEQAEKGLKKMQKDKRAISSLTLWDWIIHILKAT